MAVIAGPALICFVHGAFAVAAGEQVVQAGGGPEYAVLNIRSADGDFQVRETEIAPSAEPKGLKPLAAGARAFSLPAGQSGYVVYGPTGQPGVDAAVTILMDPASRLARKDPAALWSRVQIRNTADADCAQRLAYGWDTVEDE